MRKRNPHSQHETPPCSQPPSARASPQTRPPVRLRHPHPRRLHLTPSAGLLPVQIVGAMAGALYGDAWVPERWRDALENGTEAGRDAVLQLGADLEGLRCGEGGSEEREGKA